MEDLEQIMRRIHILFSKCEPFGDEGGEKIIVPKKELFRLLEKLNYAVIRVMDEYEATQEARERGINEFHREGERIRKDAQSGAEDVYAASLVYTDNMLEELGDVLADAKEQLWEQYARIAQRHDRQAKVLSEDQEEIHQQLGAMAQGEKYLKLIERENERLKQESEREEALKKYREGEEEDYGEDYEEEYEEEDYTEDEENGTGEEDAKEWGEEYNGEDGLNGDEEKISGEETVDSAGTKTDSDKDGLADIIKEDADTAGEKEKTHAKVTAASTPIGRAAGKKGQSAKGQKNRYADRRRVSAGRHARMSPDLEAEWAEEASKKKVRKIGTALFEDVGQPYDPPVKRATYEVKVNQAYFDAVTGGVDLDAEYWQWKEEQEQTAAGLLDDVQEDGMEEAPQVQIIGEAAETAGADKKGKKKRGLKFGKHG